MTRLMLLLVMMVAGAVSVGCQCADGYKNNKYFNTSRYRACDRSCETDYGRHDKSKCGCSTQCPCWK